MTDGVGGNRRSREWLPQRACRFRVLACALRALRACAAWRSQRRGAPPLRAASVRVSADPRAPRRGGDKRGSGAYHPQRACHFRVLACALRALRACAARNAQRRGAPPLRAIRVRVSADPCAPRHGGGERGTGTYHPHHHPRACVRADLPARSRPDLRDVPRLARARPPRLTELTAQQRTWTGRDGGRGGAPSLQLQVETCRIGGYGYVTIQDATSRSESLGLRRLEVE